MGGDEVKKEAYGKRRVCTNRMGSDALEEERVPYASKAKARERASPGQNMEPYIHLDLQIAAALEDVAAREDEVVQEADRVFDTFSFCHELFE